MIKVALFTPLHPIESGIADYAEEILPYLSQYVDIDLFADGIFPSDKYTCNNFKIYDLSDFIDLFNNYDLVVYQMGNNKYHHNYFEYIEKYPGVIILHDYAIHHTVAYIELEIQKSWDGYFDEVEFNHGIEARIIAQNRYYKNELGLWETDALRYPMNKRLISRAQGLIVFSEFAKSNIQRYGLNVPIERIYLHCGENFIGTEKNEKGRARKKLDIHLSDDEVLIGVFGFINASKRPYPIVSALKKITDIGKKVRIAFVGELSDGCKDIIEIIHNYALQDKVTFTGFADIETFKTYMTASDICISLRYPTMGETSGVLMRALSMGKPSIVSDVGTFSEIPSDCVIKISTGENEINELTEALITLISDKNYYMQISKNAFEYAEKFLKIDDTARNIAQFLDNVVLLNKIRSNKLYQEMKEDYIHLLTESKYISCIETFQDTANLIDSWSSQICELFK